LVDAGFNRAPKLIPLANCFVKQVGVFAKHIAWVLGNQVQAKASLAKEEERVGEGK
jgi:hypothetical protein